MGVYLILYILIGIVSIPILQVLIRFSQNGYLSFGDMMISVIGAIVWPVTYTACVFIFLLFVISEGFVNFSEKIYNKLKKED